MPDDAPSFLSAPVKRCTHEHPFAKIARRLNANMAASFEAIRPGYAPGELSEKTRELIGRGSK